MNIIANRKFRSMLGALTFTLLSAGPALFPTAAFAGIAEEPLFLNQNASPNIMLMLDDSGSMQFEVMPGDDDIIANSGVNYVYPTPSDTYGSSGYGGNYPTFRDELPNYYMRSNANNKIYYNPNVTYQPWSNSDGSLMSNASPAAAYWNPGHKTSGTYDLTKQQSLYARWTRCCGGWRGGMYSDKETETFWPAVYWNYDGSGDRKDIASYTKVEITDSQILVDGKAQSTITSPDGTKTRTRAEAMQNFANWFQYYRSRALLAKGGTGRAFASQGEAIRVGFATLNTSGEVLGLKQFTGQDRKDWFSTLYDQDVPNYGTPLRAALERMGKYYENSDEPWEATPGTSDPSPLSCRAAYTILMTDGYWNGNNQYIGNVDGQSGDKIVSGDGKKTYQYSPAPPYEDNSSDTLADMAMHYWNRDLRTDLGNNVPTNPDDEAFWQHMTTFTVGLGVTGSLTKDDLPALKAGTKSWPSPDKNTDDYRKIDDLFHAAVNGHGDFYSASDPASYAAALSGTLTQINQRTSSASAIATNSTRLDTDSKVYQARFDSGDWSGQLLAYNLDPDTGAVAGQAWDAADKLPAADSRNIVTYDPVGKLGETFKYSSLSAAQQTVMNTAPDGTVDSKGANRVAWIRGDRAQEQQNNGDFRNRSHVLGDIINSDPIYVSNQDFRYEYLPNPDEVDAYRTFKEDTANRTPVLYVGGNDGMLHAFNAETGVEMFAYVPAAMFSQLTDLPDPSYKHHYFVDGSPRAIDAYFADTGEFKTVLIGGYNGGQKGVYALDVSSPSTFSSTDVLWEYSEANDSSGDLGYSYSQPTVIRANDGNWYAVFGNGYASDNGSAALYILNLQDGTVAKKFVVDSGTGNGLSTVIPIDLDSDRVADYIYAGDLKGNMWRFDLSSSSSSDWNVDPSSQPGFTGNGNGNGNGNGGGNGGGNTTVTEPVFSATGPDGYTQPITARPEVGTHPDGGLMVYFGTGKYFEENDNVVPADKTSRRVYSFYGVRDLGRSNASSVLTRSNLQGQDIIAEVQTGSLIGRAVSNYDVDYSTKSGWYLDLVSPEAGRETERSVSQPLLRDGRIIFTTLIPSSDACLAGGTSWVMELDAINGKRLPYSVFDMNGDNEFSEGDYMTLPDGTKVPVSGQRSEIGIVKTPGIISAGRREYKYLSGSSGAIGVMTERSSDGTGRKSWRQIQ